MSNISEVANNPKGNTIKIGCRGCPNTFTLLSILRSFAPLSLHVIHIGQASSGFRQAALLKHGMCKGCARSHLSGQLKRGHHAYSPTTTTLFDMRAVSRICSSCIPRHSPGGHVCYQPVEPKAKPSPSPRLTSLPVMWKGS